RDGVRLDFENAPNHQLEITVTDDAGATFTKMISIEVLNVNEAIEHLALDNSTVVENAVPGTVVGTIVVSDPDIDDAHSFELVNDADGHFQIDPESGVISVANGADLNFEENSELEITVRVTDVAGNERLETMTIQITDANEAPTQMSFTPPIVASPDLPTGQEVTRIHSIDVDANDVLQYQLLNDGNGAFQIDANTGVVSVADPSRIGETDDFVLVAGVTDSAGNQTLLEVTIPSESGPLNDSDPVSNTPTQAADQPQANAEDNATSGEQDENVAPRDSANEEVDFGLNSTPRDAADHDAPRERNDRRNHIDDANTGTSVNEDARTVIRQGLDANGANDATLRQVNTIQIDPQPADRLSPAQREAGYSYINNQDQNLRNHSGDDRHDHNAGDSARQTPSRMREFVGRGGLPKLAALHEHAPAAVEQAGVDIAPSTNESQSINRESGARANDKAQFRGRVADAEPLDWGLVNRADEEVEVGFVEEAVQNVVDKPTGFVAGLWALLRGKAGLGKTEDEVLAANQKRDALGRRK
ncbi:MAG: cadherin repeat domain-containing protein, partial [Phycisphaerae bacterium]